MLTSPSDPLHILLVDDDEDDCALTRDLVSQMRAPHKAELRWASSYDAGLQAMRQPWCEVCLLDYRLGPRDGLELLGEVRSSGCTCPIIVLTGQGNDDTGALALRGGADDYLFKGDLTVALLERSVRYALERSRNLEALRASEQRYRSIFENSSDAILIAEIETQAIRYANAAAARLSGYSVSELCTMSVAALSPPDTLQNNMAEFAAVVGGTKSLAEGLPALRKDGVRMVLDVAAAPITIAGRPMIAGFFRDATERTRAGQALRASETRYRRLFEAAKDGILILDPDTGRIVDVNPYMTELTGFSRDAFVGKELWEIGLFRDVAASKMAFAQLQSQQFVRYEDLPLARGGGGTVDVEFVSNVYLVDDRKVIQCNIRDITARKRAEIEHARLAMAIEQADEAVVITDAQGTIEYVNPAFETGTGYGRAEALGQNPRLLKSGVQDAAFYAALWASISAGTTWRGRMVNRKKDGTLYSEDASITPIRNAAGAIASYVAVKRDVTDRLALDAQLLQSQKMEAVGRLAGGVAHDFNNVLSVVLTYAELVSSDLPPGSPARADLEEIRRAGQRAVDLTRQLLAFSRQQVLEMKVLDLSDSLRGVEKMIARLLGADVTLTTLAASDLWNVKVDPGQFEQILLNLAVNARDAMPLGGQLTIETANVALDDEYAHAHGGVKAGDYVVVAVSDTGSGMDAATQARIFEPFFTTKEAGKGTGLGLATVFGIVQQSGGHIWVYSEPGKGTAFKVYLPRCSRPAEKLAAPRTEPSQRGSETVLLVEDEEQVRHVARDILRRQGYVVLEASNGGEALLICEQHGARIQLLVTDVVLPRMSGRQLAERLATLRPQMRVLFMSGYTDDAILLHGILDSGVAFLQKPITPTSLSRRVRDVLDA